MESCDSRESGHVTIQLPNLCCNEAPVGSICGTGRCIQKETDKQIQKTGKKSGTERQSVEKTTAKGQIQKTQHPENKRGRYRKSIQNNNNAWYVVESDDTLCTV